MDALAKDGIMLERHYTAWSCGPSRSSLLSGRLPHHVNQHGAARVPRGFTLISAKLQQVGYSTHQIGKVRLSPSRALKLLCPMFYLYVYVQDFARA